MITPLVPIPAHAKLSVWIIDYGCDRKFFVGDTDGVDRRYTKEFESRDVARYAQKELKKLQDLTARLVR